MISLLFSGVDVSNMQSLTRDNSDRHEKRCLSGPLWLVESDGHTQKQTLTQMGQCSV